jgi:hypothetical protein
MPKVLTKCTHVNTKSEELQFICHFQILWGLYGACGDVVFRLGHTPARKGAELQNISKYYH